MKTIRDRLTRWSLVGLLMTLAAAVMYTPTASAHGEKSQAAFLRMRTIHWFDLNWSTDQVGVNEEMEISGKFHVFEGWPESVDPPEVSFLNIGIPGPVFIRKESYIGDTFVPRSVRLEIGKTYTFRVVLKARRPGEWHVHPMLNVEGGGPIIGPGKWVTITGSFAEFKDPITTLTGQTIDLETYNEGNIWFWHVLWYAIGVAWVVYFVRNPVFIPRLLMVNAGRGDELLSATDKKVGMLFGAATILLVIFGYSSAQSKYPVTIPLQAGVLRGIKPIDMPAPTVEVKVDEATYRVPGRAMKMVLTVTNNGDRPIQLCEFMTASVRFMNPEVCEDESGYPEDLLADEGLTVVPNDPIGPGETKTIEVTASDAAWEVYRLSDIIYDPDSRMGGMLFFYDDAGNRQIVIVDAPLIPTFM